MIKILKSFKNINEFKRHILSANTCNFNDTFSKIKKLQQEIQENPNDYLKYYELGVLYSDINNSNEAMNALHAALKINPIHKESLIKMAKIIPTPKIALVFLTKANSAYPDCPETMYLLANTYVTLGMLEKANEILISLIQNDEYKEKAHGLLIQNYINLVKLEEARELLDKALKLYPQNIDIQTDWALYLINTGKEKEAKKVLHSILDKDNECHAFAIFLLSCIYLKEKNFKKGMELYNFCRQLNLMEFQIHNLYTKGFNFKNKSVLVYSNSGHGDTICALRYLPYLQRLTKDITLQVNSSLIPLFEHNLKDIRIIPHGQNQNYYDVIISIDTLIYAFNMGFFRIPSSSGYIKATDKEFECDFPKDKFKVGLLYSGNQGTQRHRHIPYNKLNSLLGTENCKFYSFQIENFGEEDSNITNLSKYINNFDDTASLLSKMDLVITIDSSIAHLAGAMGIKTFLLLPYINEWYWFNDTKNTHWYKSIKIFKQNKLNDWSSVINNAQKELIKESSLSLKNNKCK